MLSLLFGFHGRISRAQYWLGTLISSFGGFMLYGLIFAAGAGAAVDATGAGQKLAILTSSSLLTMPISVLMAWSGLAVQVKRFHDRGRTGWVAALPFAVLVFMCIGGVVDAVNNVPAVAALGHAMPYLGFLWLIGLWFFVDLGCLAGTDGPNKYGNPPGSPGSSGPQPIPGAPTPSPAAFLGAQSAMDRAIAERDKAPVAKPSAPSGPATPAYATPGAAAVAGARTFGRRTGR